MATTATAGTPDRHRPTASARARARARADRPDRRRLLGAITPYLFVAPALFFFAIWVLYPIVQSFIVSLYESSGLGTGQFVGFANYVELFHSEQFWTSLRNNVLWLALFSLALPFGLAAALFLNQQIRGMRLAKTLFFFPFVLSRNIVFVAAAFCSQCSWPATSCRSRS